jgi:hypothetical protein
MRAVKASMAVVSESNKKIGRTRNVGRKGWMIKERFQELSNQLNTLRKQSDLARNLQERRSLIQQMRTILKEIDELLRSQTEPYLRAASPGQQSEGN